jgi:glycosyltransferase involved in cell wall biosynthesis
MPQTPLVSIVTPTLNMGQFLEETIGSVLEQDYPRIEYIVMDGGSADGSLAILDRYRDRLRYHSGPDRGAADAINRGFELSRGDLFAFLNADDTYLPNAVSTAVARLIANPDAAGVYGQAYWVDKNGRVLRPYPTRAFDPALFQQECFICQPATLLRRTAFEEAGRMNPDLHYAFDYDLWIRLARVGRMAQTGEFLATSRVHPASKTVGRRKQALQETLRLLGARYGYAPFAWAHTYASYLLDGRDPFLEEPRPSIAKYLLSLPIRLAYNLKQPVRFIGEWASVMTPAALARRWRALTQR